MLQLKNIVKQYTDVQSTTTAVDNLTIRFRKHEFVSILGPSGCGKTSLLNIIGGPWSVYEWRAHNYMYDKNIERSWTASVDLNDNESKLKLIAYTAQSLLYRP